MLAWYTVNNLLVNPNKTKCMLIGPKHKLNSINLELKINDACIELVESHKIVGVHVDKHLSWNIHIDKTCTAINNKNNLLKRILTYLAMEMKYYFTTRTYCLSSSIVVQFGGKARNIEHPNYLYFKREQLASH